MDKSIVIKALLNGVLTWIVVVLILRFVKGVPLEQAFTAPYTIAVGIAGAVGSYIGYLRRKK